MKKILPLILCLALLLGCLPGCAAEDTPYVPHGDALAPEDADVNVWDEEEEEVEQKLTLAYYPNRSMNPFTANDYTNRTLFSLIYQGLFSVSADFEPVPMLCENYRVSSDYKIYTVYIHDATFSDGTTVTIEDVRASIAAAQNSKYYSGRFTHLIKMEINEDRSISFYLRTAMEDFLTLLDIPVVKAEQVEAEHPIGTGPYIFESSLTGARLRRNSGWWYESPDLLVTANLISLVPADSPTQIRDEFEFADVGLVCTDPCSDTYADYRCDYELWNCDNGIMVYIGCNIAYSQEDVFQKDTLRSALTYAIDREELVKNNYNGFARPTAIAMDPGHAYYSEALNAKYGYDPVKFINAMSMVKLPKEPIRLLVNSDDSMRMRLARSIVEMLTECGLNIVMVEKKNSEFIQDVKYGKYDLYLGQTRLPPNMDLSEFFRPWGNLSWGSVDNEGLYTLCKDALDNHGNYYNLHKALADDGRIIPLLFCGYAVYADRGLVSELEPSRDNVFFYTLGRSYTDALIPIDYHNNQG